jgi:hypothetical protein
MVARFPRVGDMPAKHLIIVHGRDIKPAGSELSALAKKALARGLERAGKASTADKIRQGEIKFSSAYYGDINNELEASFSNKTAALLTAQNDAEYSFKPCFPIVELKEAFVRTDAINTFNLTSYRHVLDIADDWRFLEEAADAASLFGSLLTFGLLNTLVIEIVKSDLTAYLTSQVVGSKIRARLQAVLEPAMLAGDDLCLVTHSLGCMVAYDVFWKYSFRGEYKHMREASQKVSLWLTLGCPLGELGVKLNLLDAMALADEKYPRNQFLDWVNVYAEDDYIAHAERMRSAFSRMRSKGYCREISDKKIYNCWHYRDAKKGDLVSNPHDLYGYLMHQDTAKFVDQWAG